MFWLPDGVKSLLACVIVSTEVHSISWSFNYASLAVKTSPIWLRSATEPTCCTKW